jgi:hypothetical protein
MAPEDDILQRIRSRRRRVEGTVADEKNVTTDITRPEDVDPNVSTADLAQTAKTQAERRADLVRDSREPLNPPRSASRSDPNTTPTSSTGIAVARAKEEKEARGPLFAAEEAQTLHAQWENIQVGFVDEPRSAVERADHLVAETMKRLAEIFAGERERLEHQWDRGENVSTEHLRLALRRYRAFFERLLAI